MKTMTKHMVASGCNEHSETLSIEQTISLTRNDPKDTTNGKNIVKVIYNNNNNKKNKKLSKSLKAIYCEYEYKKRKGEKNAQKNPNEDPKRFLDKIRKKKPSQKYTAKQKNCVGILQN